MARLTLENLVIGYSHNKVGGPFHGVFEGGCVHALAGPNGCGKTTLLRTLIGLIPPISGQVVREPANTRIAYVPQISTFDDDLPLSAREVIGLALLNEPPDRRRELVKEVLVRAHLEHVASLRFAHLSGGQKQRILLARSMAIDAPFLILDEPTAAVDYASTRDLWTMIRNSSRTGTRVTLVVSHDLFAIREFADKTWILEPETLRTGEVTIV